MTRLYILMLRLRRQEVPLLVPCQPTLVELARRFWLPILLSLLAVLSLVLHEAVLEVIFATGLLLVGQEAEGTAAEEALTSEIGISYKYTATATDKVTALHVTLSANGSGTSGKLAVQADEGGTKPKEGVLCEGTISSLAIGEHTTGALTAEPEVTSGTVYWITIIPLGGTAKMKAGTTTSRTKATVKHLLISEVKTADWGAAANKGPASIWATGAGTTTAQEVMMV